jgi:hypothetical protein
MWYCAGRTGTCTPYLAPILPLCQCELGGLVIQGVGRVVDSLGGLRVDGIGCSMSLVECGLPEHVAAGMLSKESKPRVRSSWCQRDSPGRTTL